MNKMPDRMAGASALRNIQMMITTSSIQLFFSFPLSTLSLKFRAIQFLRIWIGGLLNIKKRYFYATP